MLPIAFLCVAAAAVASAHDHHSHALAARAGLPQLPAFYVPPQVFAEVPASSSAGFAPQSFGNPLDIAKAYVAEKSKTNAENLKVTSSITDPVSGVNYMHLIQTVNGIEITNLVSNVNVNADGNIVSAGVHVPSSPIPPLERRSVFGSLFGPSHFSAKQAVVAAAKVLGHSTTGLKYRLRARDGVVTGAPTSLSAKGEVQTREKYFLTPEGKLEKVWEVQLEQDDFWGVIYMSAETNEPIAATNWVSDSRFDFDVEDMMEPIDVIDMEEDVSVDDAEDVDPEDDAEFDDIEADHSPRTTRSKATRLPRTTRTKATRTTRARTTRVRTTRVRTTRVRTTRVRTTRARTTRTRGTRTKTPKTTSIALTTSASSTSTAVPTTASTTTTVTFSVPTTTTRFSTATTFSLPTTTRVSTTFRPPFTIPPVASLPTATFTGAIPTPTLRVVPYNEESMDAGQQLLVDPALLDASPNGWFGNLQINNELITAGNNLRAARVGQLGVSRNGGQFDAVYDPEQDATVPQNIEAAIANTFYVSNMYHDLLYRFGFDEKSANFQYDNFEKGGKGNDGIDCFVQSAEGLNNANFASPPDGLPGRMRMYVFDRTTPRRDSDLDNGIIIHELTHGLSNRLTGGTGNANCLQTLESRGMGEGWSDTLGWWASMKSKFDRTIERPMGLYVLNNTRGVRLYPYSTNLTVNPYMYSDVITIPGVHAIGTVWSTALYEVYWNMVEAGGFTSDIFDVQNSAANIKFMKDVVDGLKLQPCNPTFLSARDAIIQAEKLNNGGKYVCEMWRGFAKRGLGLNATPGVNNFELGDGCV
ncbi:hypothetical protein HDU67_005524 [Dinochytrium kinnereticum]|nr:hypothetical protein HDU67_005524 [Dinochytrium kinnereticum]